MKTINENPNQRVTLSQTRAILQFMEEGNSITPEDARRLFGSSRLSGRIKDIEKIIGYPPQRKMVQVAGKDARGNLCLKRVMSYWLDSTDKS